MKRRRALLAVAAGLAALPLDLFAQTAAKRSYRVALVFTNSPVAEMSGSEPKHPGARAFVGELRARGYVENMNLTLERRSAEGRFEQIGMIIEELVRLKSDVLVTAGDDMTRRAMQVTSTIPIVLVSDNPVEAGLVKSLARPGGNVTGVTVTPGLEFEAKRLELLKDVLPKASHVAYLVTKAGWDNVIGKSVQDAGHTLGVTISLAEHAPDNYENAFAALLRDRPDALLVATSPTNFAYRRKIADFAVSARLPAIFAPPEGADAGGFMSYGVNIGDVFRRAAIHVDKILKGAKPGDLPIELPTKFELVVNLKTAQALGLKVSQAFLFRADRIIE